MQQRRARKAYAEAEALLATGDYKGASAAFAALQDYKDAASRADAARSQQLEAENAQAYANAEALLDAGNYAAAAKAFQALGDYKDAAERAQDCPYIEAEQLLAQG